MLIVFTIFLGIVAYLVASSFVRKTLPTFEPSPIDPVLLGGDTVVSDTVTVDARDPTRWRFLDLDRRSVTPYQTRLAGIWHFCGFTS